MNNTAERIIKELKKCENKKFIESEKHFFKEPIKTHGLTSQETKEVAKRYFEEIKNLSLPQIFVIAEKLLKTGYNQEIFIVFNWLYRLQKKYSKQHFVIFEKWLKKHIANWATNDDFSTHALGYFLFTFPEFLPKVKQWAKAKNRWVKRSSATSLIYSLRRKKYFKELLAVSETLLTDTDLMVQKGYGWALKEATEHYPKEVLAFVMKHKKIMPRTALRYAIEKLSPAQKKLAMKK
jgi:3-methyladenine DNA glycosylase AlkD